MTVFLTGDLHSGFDMAKLITDDATTCWGDCKPTTGDYLIVTGDFGFPWDFSADELADITWLESRPYRVLFVDGNHERFDYWAKRPLEEWHGGLVQRLAPRSPILRLTRGEIYEIDGDMYFTLGGATSPDKSFRHPFEDWWPAELPDEHNFEEARQNLDAIDWNVDYVVTHTCSTSLLPRALDPAHGRKHGDGDRLTDFFDELEMRLTFKHWYFGHFHKSVTLDEHHTVLYDAIVRAGELVPQWFTDE